MVNQVDQFEWYWTHKLDFYRECVFIRDRNRQLIPLGLNYPQLVLHEIIEKQVAEEGRARVIIDKARRLGVSTYVEARFYQISSFLERTNVYIVSHRDDSCDVLFDMAKLMQENNPMGPGVKKTNKKQLLFKIGSQYALSSADSPGAAKSRDITLFHGSEVAEWRAGDELLNSLLPCLPPHPAYSEAILESTAKGYGNLFQRWTFKAWAEGAHPYYEKDGFIYAWKNPDFEWVIVFFPWFRHPDYFLAFDNEEHRQRFEAEHINRKVYNRDQTGNEDARSYEKKLMDTHGLTLEQLHWYIYVRENEFDGKFDKMREQYPSTLLESFVSTGGNVFGAELCDRLEKECFPHIREGNLIERSGQVVLNPMKYAPVRIWEHAQPGVEYLVTVDPAGGKKDHQTDKNEPDYTCMDVWRRTDKYLVQVAQWHGHIDADRIADEAMMLARLYPRAGIAVLRMNHGGTVIALLKKAGWGFIVEDDDRQDGLNEDRKRKPLMVDSLLRDARDGLIVFRSLESVQELRTYIDRDGKTGAEDGCNDDRVSSAYCGTYVNRDLPLPVDSRRRKHGRKGDTVRLANFDRHIEDQERKYGNTTRRSDGTYFEYETNF